MALSQLLRHDALKQGVSIAQDGFASWEQISTLPRFASVDYTQVERVVADNAKQRFMLKTDAPNGRKLIRCNQGHSFPDGTIDSERLLTPITLATAHNYPFVV